MEKILYYAYDPFKTFGVRKFRPINHNGKHTFSDAVWNILDALAARRLSGNDAKDFVNGYRKILTYKSRTLFERILLKDLRCGVSTKLINLVFDDMIAEGITMQPNPYENRLAHYPYLCSLKLRGVRGYYKHSDNTLYSRSGRPYSGLKHITNILRPCGVNFDGELIVPGIPFEDGSGMVRSMDTTPQVVYCVFDSPDKVRTFENRCILYTLYLKNKSDKVIPVKHTLIYDEVGLKTMFNNSIDNGYEGVVAKNPVSLYKPGYTNEWLKMKEIAEPIDLEIVGFYEGEGKYKDMLGGIVVLFNGTEVNVGGGFDDVQRWHWWKYNYDLIGKTAEVEYQEITKHGSLRNPIFLRMREDK